MELWIKSVSTELQRFRYTPVRIVLMVAETVLAGGG